VLADLKGAQSVMDREITGLDLVKGLESAGFHDVAENLLTVLRQRVSGDLLQTSAVLTADFTPLSAINDPNDYAGPAPGTGSRASAGSSSRSCATSRRRPTPRPRWAEP
jgi:Propanediol dehydratase, large subunit